MLQEDKQKQYQGEKPTIFSHSLLDQLFETVDWHLCQALADVPAPWLRGQCIPLLTVHKQQLSDLAADPS